jgi:hypothetical protein
VPRLLVLLAALAVVVSGCGSGPSRTEFVRKADALCTATNRAHPPKPRPRSGAQAAAQETEEIAVRRELDAKLKALEVPDSLRSDFDAYNEGTRRVIAAIEVMRADARSRDKRKFQFDSRGFERAATAREKVAIRIGFRVCGRQAPK